MYRGYVRTDYEYFLSSTFSKTVSKAYPMFFLSSVLRVFLFLFLCVQTQRFDKSRPNCQSRHNFQFEVADKTPRLAHWLNLLNTLPPDLWGCVGAEQFINISTWSNKKKKTWWSTGCDCWWSYDLLSCAAETVREQPYYLHKYLVVRSALYKIFAFPLSILCIHVYVLCVCYYLYTLHTIYTSLHVHVFAY